MHINPASASSARFPTRAKAELKRERERGKKRQRGREDLDSFPVDEINNILFSLLLDILDITSVPTKKKNKHGGICSELNSETVRGRYV